MTLQDALVLVLAVAACGYVARIVWRKLAGRGGCGCGHGTNGCSAKSGVGGAKLTTLVELERPKPPIDRGQPTS